MDSSTADPLVVEKEISRGNMTALMTVDMMALQTVGLRADTTVYEKVATMAASMVSE